MKFETTDGFDERYRERANKHVKQDTIKAMKLFVKNPHDNKLNLKPLVGDLKGFHSIDVNEDYRIILELRKRKPAIFFNFGAHNQLYYSPEPDRPTEHYYIN